jgi:hypothetical protein
MSALDRIKQWFWKAGNEAAETVARGGEPDATAERRLWRAPARNVDERPDAGRKRRALVRVTDDDRSSVVAYASRSCRRGD